MDLSIFSHVVKGKTPEEVARKTRAYGLRSVHLLPRQTDIGFGHDTSVVEAVFEHWAEAYHHEGVEISGIAGYINPLDPDPVRRQAGIGAFKSYLSGAKVLGCRDIATETGTYATAGAWDFDPRTRTPEAWEDLCRVTDELLEVAVKADVTILYEPYIMHVCHSPELGAQFVRQYNTTHLGLVMDPTNWFEVDDVRPELVPAIVQRGFAAERGLFRVAHAKDVLPPEPGGTKPRLPEPGQGILDYALYMRLLREHGYRGSIILEHLAEPEIPRAIAYVQRFLNQDDVENRSTA